MGTLCSVLIVRLMAVFAVFAMGGTPGLHAADLSSTYAWNSVRIGAGGLLTGFVTHPLNANIRYCRTDVGNAYRWDSAANEWVPMVVRNADGTGFPADVTVVPATTGITSIAIDPNNVNVVMVVLPMDRGANLVGSYPSLGDNVYRSTDGGITFVKGNLNTPGRANGNFRMNGERLKVDPNNSNIVYFCTYSSGVYRSLDAGATWAPVTTGGIPGASLRPLNVHFYKNGGTTTAFGATVSSVVYISGGRDSTVSTPTTDIFKSTDGGQNWTNITTGTALSNNTNTSSLDQNGNLWVGSTYTSPIHVWKYNGSTWSTETLPNNSDGTRVISVAVDPNNANRAFAVTNSSMTYRRVNGVWTLLGRFQFANSVPWAQSAPSWHTNGGIFFDVAGKLWVPEGNDGMLSYTPTAGNTETSIAWNISYAGIEELVTRDVIIPKGSGDKVVTAVEDEGGMLITDPDQFTADKYNVTSATLSGVSGGIAVCPNATNYVVTFTTNAYVPTYSNNSAYSNDGGTTWTKFPASMPTSLQTGNIAVSRRDSSWVQGGDHLVILPSIYGGNTRGRAPYYSKNGGTTWTASTSFPVDGNGQLTSVTGIWSPSTPAQILKADPFVKDKFYIAMCVGGFYVSNNGGETWALGGSGLPQSYTGNLEVNYNVQNDLWFADGSWSSGTSHGLFHAAPGSNNVFTKVSGIDYAYKVTLGASRGQPGDAAYTVYFYGKLTGDAGWGVFRSVNGGVSWDRISYYPAGLIDAPYCMAASWDTFGLVYIGFRGNSYVYGQLLSPHAAFFQNFNGGSAIANFTGTGYNQFTTVQQGTGGGFTINGNNELLITHGSDTTNRYMLATGGNLMNSLQTGFIMKGTVRAAANPNSATNRYGINLTFGAGGTNPVTDVFFKINGTAAAPTVSLQSQSAGTTGTGGSTVGAPFWIVVNRTGAAVTYTRPDGLSKTLGSGKLDLWFGADGNNGAVKDVWLAYPSYVIDSFWFTLAGSWSSSNGCAVAIDDLKVSKIEVGTTQF